LQDVTHPTVYQTLFASPQMELFELDDEQWLKIRQRSYQRRQKRALSLAKQLPLNGLEVAILMICYIMVEHLWGNFFPNV
jgi:hypothetical protein